MNFIKEFLQFTFSRKKFWLIPVLLILLIIGFGIVFGQGSVFTPFIYTIF